MEQLFYPPHKKWLYLFVILTSIFGLLTIALVIMDKHRDHAIFVAAPFMLTALSMYHTVECLRKARIATYKNELFNLLLERPRLICIKNRRLVLDTMMFEMYDLNHKKYRILSQSDFLEVITAVKRREAENE